MGYFPIFALAFALLLSSCSSSRSNPSETMMVDLEKRLVLPQGSAPVGNYNRFYEIRADTIEGVMLEVAEAGRISIVPAGHLPLERRDGGCGVIHVQYDRLAKSWKPALCQQRA